MPPSPAEEKIEQVASKIVRLWSYDGNRYLIQCSKYDLEKEIKKALRIATQEATEKAAEVSERSCICGADKRNISYIPCTCGCFGIAQRIRSDHSRSAKIRESA